MSTKSIKHPRQGMKCHPWPVGFSFLKKHRLARKKKAKAIARRKYRTRREPVDYFNGEGIFGVKSFTEKEYKEEIECDFVHKDDFTDKA